ERIIGEVEGLHQQRGNVDAADVEPLTAQCGVAKPRGLAEPGRGAQTSDHDDGLGGPSVRIRSGRRPMGESKKTGAPRLMGQTGPYHAVNEVTHQAGYRNRDTRVF